MRLVRGFSVSYYSDQRSEAIRNSLLTIRNKISKLIDNSSNMIISRIANSYFLLDLIVVIIRILIDYNSISTIILAIKLDLNNSYLSHIVRLYKL